MKFAALLQLAKRLAPVVAWLRRVFPEPPDHDGPFVPLPVVSSADVRRYQRVTVLYDRGGRNNEQQTFENVGVDYGVTRVFEIHHDDGRVVAIPLTRVVCFELFGPEDAR